MADVNALAASLRANASAKADALGLAEELAQARVLENTGAPKARSFLSGVVGNLDRHKGRMDAARLQPQLNAARQAAAQHAGADTIHRATALDENEQHDRQWAAGADERALKRALGERKQQAGDAASEPMVNTRTGEEAMVQVNGQTGQLSIDGQPVDSRDWTTANASRYNDSLSGSGSGDEAGSFKIDELSDAFIDEYANPSGGYPMAGTISNMVAREAPILSTEGMERRQLWWSNYKQFYEMPIRHENYGSALTATEKEQWRQATINPNMTAKQIREKLEILRRIDGNVQKRIGNNPFNVDFVPSAATGRSGPARPARPQVQLTPDQTAAKEWAEQNPYDPRAIEILDDLPK